jgi:hypothetical protein
MAYQCIGTTSIVPADYQAVQRLAELGHVLGLDLDPVVVAVVELVGRARVLYDQAFGGASDYLPELRLDLGFTGGRQIRVDLDAAGYVVEDPRFDYSYSSTEAIRPETVKTTYSGVTSGTIFTVTNNHKIPEKPSTIGSKKCPHLKFLVPPAQSPQIIPLRRETLHDVSRVEGALRALGVISHCVGVKVSAVRTFERQIVSGSSVAYYKKKWGLWKTVSAVLMVLHT